MRKPIQILGTSTQIGDIAYSSLVVLCDDGLVVQYSPRDPNKWTPFPSIPSGDLTEIDPSGGAKLAEDLGQVDG